MVAIPGFATFSAADLGDNLRIMEQLSQQNFRERQNLQGRIDQMRSQLLSEAGANLRQRNALRAGAAQAGLVVNEGAFGQLSFDAGPLLQEERETQQNLRELGVQRERRAQEGTLPEQQLAQRQLELQGELGRGRLALDEERFMREFELAQEQLDFNREQGAANLERLQQELDIQARDVEARIRRNDFSAMADFLQIQRMQRLIGPEIELLRQQARRFGAEADVAEAGLGGGTARRQQAATRLGAVAQAGLINLGSVVADSFEQAQERNPDMLGLEGVRQSARANDAENVIPSIENALNIFQEVTRSQRNEDEMRGAAELFAESLQTEMPEFFEMVDRMADLQFDDQGQISNVTAKERPEPREIRVGPVLRFRARRPGDPTGEQPLDEGTTNRLRNLLLQMQPPGLLQRAPAPQGEPGRTGAGTQREPAGPPAPRQARRTGTGTQRRFI